MNMMHIPGLIIRRDFLTAAEHQQILSWIDLQPWSAALRRRTQHYGWRYSYDRRPLSRAQDYVGELPVPMADLAQRVSEYFPRLPDQVIINEYLRGQRISTHIDHVSNFGPIVASISLGAPGTLRFSRAGTMYDIVVAPGDLLVMTEDARYRWAHETLAATERRLSITFRTVRLEQP